MEAGGELCEGLRLHSFNTPRWFYQISGLEPYRCMLEGEKLTRSESEGGRREAKITALATPEP